MELALKSSFVIADLFRRSTWTLKFKSGRIGFSKSFPYKHNGKTHLLDIGIYEASNFWEWSIEFGHIEGFIVGKAGSVSECIKNMVFALNNRLA